MLTYYFILINSLWTLFIQWFVAHPVVLRSQDLKTRWRRDGTWFSSCMMTCNGTFFSSSPSTTINSLLWWLLGGGACLDHMLCPAVESYLFEVMWLFQHPQHCRCRVLLQRNMLLFEDSKPWQAQSTETHAMTLNLCCKLHPQLQTRYHLEFKIYVYIYIHIHVYSIYVYM